MRIQAIRASETLYKAGDKSFDADYRAAAKDTDPDVALQAMLTLNVLKVADAPAVIQATMAANKARGVQEIGKVAARAADRARRPRHRRRCHPSSRICCSAARRSTRRPASRATATTAAARRWPARPPGTMMAPPLAGSPRVQGHRDYVDQGAAARADRSAGRQDVHAGHAADGRAEGRLDRGHRLATCATTSATPATFVTPADVARVRAATSGAQDAVDRRRSSKRRCRSLLQRDPAWKVTASHNPAAAPDALTIVGWTSGVPQQAGMWLQVELPQPLTLTEVQFNIPPAAAVRRRARRRRRREAARPRRPVRRLRQRRRRVSTSCRSRRTGRRGRPRRGASSVRSPSPPSHRSARSSCASRRPRRRRVQVSWSFRTCGSSRPRRRRPIGPVARANAQGNTAEAIQ